MVIRSGISVRISNIKNFEIWLSGVTKGGKRALRQLAEKTANELKKASAGNVFRGDIQRLTQAVKLSDTEWVIEMPQHAIWLDSMKPHRVTPYRTRDIYYWAEAKGPAGSHKWPSIFVRPHPFIDKALDNSAKNRSVTRQLMVQAIKQELKKFRR